jgi:TolB-like protein
MIPQLWLLCLPLLAVTAEARDRMAVLDLAPAGFDRTESLLLSQRLRHEFDKNGYFNLVERSDLYAFIEGKRLDDAACDEACLQTIGRALGTKWVVSGSIRSVGNRIHIEALLYDVNDDFILRQVTRKVDLDPERIREKEMRRLVQELVPDGGSTGIPWWLLVLGAGGGAAYWATQSGDDTGPGNGNGNDNGGDDPALSGAADITGTFPAP